MIGSPLCDDSPAALALDPAAFVCVRRRHLGSILSEKSRVTASQSLKQFAYSFLKPFCIWNGKEFWDPLIKYRDPRAVILVWLAYVDVSRGDEFTDIL